MMSGFGLLLCITVNMLGITNDTHFRALKLLVHNPIYVSEIHI